MELLLNELHLNEEQLRNFTWPSSYHQYFSRNIIKEMDADQFNLFDVVVQFADEDSNITRKEKSILMYLVANPNLKCISYIEIWFQLARKFYRSQPKTLIPHSDLEQIMQTRNQRLLNFQNHLQ